MTLPPPDSAAIAHSNAVCAYILNKSQSHKVDFADFMNQSLYAPHLGYYSAGLNKFGSQGDFVTAPEISPLFGQCLANVCAESLEQLEQGVILEFGAGSGRLALDIVTFLAEQHQQYPDYYILEISADLRQRQQQLFQQNAPEYRKQIHWLEQLPDTPLNAVVLANEVLDAMPVNCFVIDAKQQPQALYAYWQGQQFQWQTQPPSAPLKQALTETLSRLEQPLTQGYRSEINLNIQPWLQALAAVIHIGRILLIDYGQDQQNYYQAQRHQGTLRCHYRHYAHDDPFFYPGLQDITADVDFTAVAIAADLVGFKVAGYTSQAEFLLNSGLVAGLEQALACQDQQTFLHTSQHAKQLILPQAMGERFKVMLLEKGLNSSNILGFAEDKRYLL